MNRVLVFDDDHDWADQMALTLNEFSPQPISNPDDWNKHIATRWSAIVVDVQILGSTMNGPDMAARAILEYGITAPVIVVSGIIRLDEIRQKYGDVFFDYVHKDDCGQQLPSVVGSACSRDGLERHLRGMLVRIAADTGVLDKEFPADSLGEPAAQLAQSSSARTVKELVDALISGDKPHIDKMGKEILEIIHFMAPGPWP